MTRTVELDVAQTTLKEIIAGLKPNDEVLIIEDNKPVACLSATKQERPPRKPGLLKGRLSIVVEDDEHLRDFEEYMD